MRYNNHTSACCRRSVSALIASGVVLMPASLAHAQTLDELVETVTSSTELTFGTGAAAGAVVAGLLGVIVHTRSKRRYKKQIKSLEEDVASALASQVAAEARLQALIMEDDVSGEDEDQVVADIDVPAAAEDASDDVHNDVTDMPTEVLQAMDEQEDGSEEYVGYNGETKPFQTVEDEVPLAEPEPEAVVETAQAVEDQSVWAMEEEPEAEASMGAEDVADVSEDSSPASFARHKTVRAILEERLTPDALNEGAGRYSASSGRVGIPAFVGHRRMRHYDPVVRASLIDQRVPRFDESLFPDVVTHVHDEVDVFETAMRAMEDTLQHTAVLGIEEEDPSIFEQPEPKSDSFNVAEYVEYLLQDELEKTRSGEPLTTNHPHLTMFDGTGDLSASKDLGKHSPDHMRLVPNES